MAIKVGINGFGRMGRLALRAGWGRPDLEFVHINEVAGGPETAAHLLTFDSVHGRWNRRVAGSGGQVEIDGAAVGFSAVPKPGDVPWSARNVDIVLECSGKFRTTETLDAYFASGVKKVIVAAPVKSGALNIVMGVNDHLYEPGTASTADSGFVHDELPRARRQGDSRIHRHHARGHHDDPRHHEHASRGGRTAQGSASCTSE